MRIVCESCGHTGEAADVRVDGTRVVVSCERCGAESVLGGASPVSTAAVAPSPPSGSVPAELSADAPAGVDPSTAEVSRDVSPPADLPPVKCPKCGHRQHDSAACHKCGLVFALVDDGRRPWERVPPGKKEAVDRAQELWAAVEAAPHDERRHGDLADHCRANGIPEWAAMRYRHWLADHPDDTLAARFQARAVADAQIVAQAMVRGESRDFAENAKRVRVALLGIVIVMLVIATIIVIRMFSARPTMPF